MRLWETGGRTGRMLLGAPGYRTALETDLRERARLRILGLKLIR